MITAFQFRNGFAERIACRVTRARIIVGALFVVALERVVAGEIERRGDGAVHGVAIDTGACHTGCFLISAVKAVVSTIVKVSHFSYPFAQ